jgi:hypothetical protein
VLGLCLHRALEELRHACAAANNAAVEAEASATATTAALHEQLLQVKQLRKRLDDAAERHQYELRAVKQSAAEQVKVVRAEAAAELEAAQTRLQLVRLKQQRLMQGINAGGSSSQQRLGVTTGRSPPQLLEVEVAGRAV